MTSPTRIAARIDAADIVISANGDDDFGQISYTTEQLRPFADVVIDSPNPVEFFELFLTLYTADRLVKRRGGWQRRFVFEFPVSDVDRWRGAAPTLRNLIRQSTGDDVEFEFAHRPEQQRHRDTFRVPFALETPRPTAIVLLSDGLDSYCGAVQQLSARPQERLCFVSLSTNTRKGARINDVRAHLQRLRVENLTFCGSFFHLDDPPRSSAQERSQRSRTMLAIAAGFVVSAAYDSQDVIVSENGLGILNLPVPNLQMDHFSSQVLHPANVPLWSEIAALLWGSKAKLVYPNRFRTKAEMCASLPPDALDAIRYTTSCDAPRRDVDDACGTCGSCLVRRRALDLPGLASFDGTYSATASQRGAPMLDAFDVQSYHARELKRRLEALDPWSALVKYQPTLRTSVVDSQTPTAHLRYETMQLLQRHITEVIAFEQLQRAH
jgi:7-cyano-7-deazaguanine synthase in queuosine biosynthesis